MIGLWGHVRLYFLYYGLKFHSLLLLFQLLWLDASNFHFPAEICLTSVTHAKPNEKMAFPT